MIVPSRPDELGFTQFDTWRPFQRQTIQRVVDAPAGSVEVVCAPVGAGKSMIALGVGLMYGRYQQRTTILTHQRALQRQYMGYELSEPARSATGRDNWECILPDYEGVRASQAPCTDGFVCHEAQSDSVDLPNCPYYRQRAQAERAKVRVLNYPYFFLQRKRGGFRSNLLVCDEGHRLDKALLESARVHFTREHLDLLARWTLSMPPVREGALLESRRTALADWCKAVEMQCIADKTEKDRDAVRSLRQQVTALALLCRIGATAIHIGNDFVPAVPEELAFLLTQDMHEPRKVVVMSASMFDADYAAARLGLPNTGRFIDIPSTFPVGRRPVFVQPVLRMNYSSTKDNAELYKMAGAIDDIAVRYARMRGLVHCGSYEVGAALAERLRCRERVVLAERGASHLEDYLAREDALYISPSAYEGLDLHDDLCLAEGTRVLTRDLRWVPIETIRVGDQLVGVDEHVAPHKYRKLRYTTVENVANRTAPVLKITTTHGVIRATAEHPFLATALGRRAGWFRADQLRPGYRLRWLTTPTQADSSREAGYLAGFYDGEGCVTTASRANGTYAHFGLTVAQKPGLTLTAVERLLAEIGVNYVRRDHPHGGRGTVSYLVHRGNLSEHLHFLTRIRPERLIRNLDLTGLAGRDGYRARVLSVEPDGETTVWNLATDARTYFAEGFAVHNCRFNIVAKLSWPHRGDPVTAVQLERIDGFNEYEAASALIQSIGRGMRHDADLCHSFILDATYWQLWARTRDKLPAWFRDALIMPRR